MVRGTFSPPGRWRPTVGYRLPRTLGLTRNTWLALAAPRTATCSPVLIGGPASAAHGMGAEAPSSVRSKSPGEAGRVKSPSKSSASREPLAALDARFQSQFVGPPPRGAVWLRPAWLVAAGIPLPRPSAPEFAPSAVLWPARWSTRAASPSPVRPNPSLKGSANGRPPGPGRRYAVHCLRPGPGVLPSSPP